MIRLLTLTLLLLVGPAQSQLTTSGVGGGFGHSGGGPAASGCAAGSTTAYANFVARSGSLGADDCNYRILFNNLLGHGFFNSDGTTSALCFLYIFAAPAQATALLDLTPNAHNGTTTGTVSFSAHNGFTGDSATFFIDTGIAPASCQNVTLTNASIGYYGLSSRTSGVVIAMGANDGTNYTYFLNFNAGPVIQVDLLSGSFTGPASGGANADGFWIATKTADPNVNLYHNASGTDLGPINAASVTGNTTKTMYIFAENNNGSGAFFVGDQMSAVMMGSGMSSASYLNLQSDINTFMTAYSINKY